MWGSNQMCLLLKSDRAVNGATQSTIGDLDGLSSLSGVWGGAPVANGFWKIFDQMELVFINCLPCQKDCTRFWTGWWCCNLILISRVHFYIHLFSFIWLKYNSPLKSYVSRLLESRGIPTGFSLNFHMVKRNPVRYPWKSRQLSQFHDCC